MSQKAQILPHWLNRTDMAKSCGISPQAFDKWGVPSAAKHGREVFFTVDDVLENRLAWQEQRINREREKDSVEGPTQAQMDQELMLLRREQRTKLELENAQTRHETAPIALLDRVLSDVGGQIAAIFESIPAKLKRVAPKLTATDLELVTRELVKAQNAAASAKAKLDGYLDLDAPGDQPGGDAGSVDS
jgi:phage terminase Nu1 subunit (DNA packaging protein)